MRLVPDNWSPSSLLFIKHLVFIPLNLPEANQFLLAPTQLKALVLQGMHLTLMHGWIYWNSFVSSLLALVLAVGIQTIFGLRASVSSTVVVGGLVVLFALTLLIQALQYLTARQLAGAGLLGVLMALMALLVSSPRTDVRLFAAPLSLDLDFMFENFRLDLPYSAAQAALCLCAGVLGAVVLPCAVRWSFAWTLLLYAPSPVPGMHGTLLTAPLLSLIALPLITVHLPLPPYVTYIALALFVASRLIYTRMSLKQWFLMGGRCVDYLHSTGSLTASQIVFHLRRYWLHGVLVGADLCALPITIALIALVPSQITQRLAWLSAVALFMSEMVLWMSQWGVTVESLISRPPEPPQRTKVDVKTKKQKRRQNPPWYQFW